MSNIKAIRSRLGLTQVALAKGIGCTQGNIGHYEHRGQMMPPDVARRLIGYAKSLGQAISFDDIYAESSDSLQTKAGQSSPVLNAGEVARLTAAVELAPEGQGARPAAELLTADPALSVELTRAEQAGLVKLPKQAPQWDGAERRAAKAQRRAVDRKQDIAQTGQGAA